MDVILEQLETHTQNKPNDIALHITGSKYYLLFSFASFT